MSSSSASATVFSSFVPGAHAKDMPATQHQLGVQARVVEYLKRYGGIDALNVIDSIASPHGAGLSFPI